MKNVSVDTTAVNDSRLQTAVLFLVFNRPDTTAKVFEAIRKARPPRLYVAADGPRASRSGEWEIVAEVRAIATAVDWDCEVKTLFRERNLGCKNAVSSAITWFFEHEEQGVILEDDCLPHPDFFMFCETLLKRYAGDTRISTITGNNFQNGIARGDASYYFSRYSHIWGWATWERAWGQADMDLEFWPVWKKSRAWANFWSDKTARRYWERIFDRMRLAEIDTWDYPWMASVWYHGGLTAVPNVNLVSNIGFGPDATHTQRDDSPLANLQAESIGDLQHPIKIEQNEEADRYTFEHLFGGGFLRFPNSLLRFPRRAVGVTYRFLKRALA
ncbi:protein containing nucleotide-diphospho-sugar transferase domain [Luminiphilus syltensis NOR5-1B]|uniref:Protein containing nucleotide-diphospho-sugar transferase domain n=1 Tax=Luminiphilus syltensis NOR5-1B TaxID=565045 RepID=B8KUZ5_9GAMM|nr:protein containing nucleotide-diphospho-sugar transferase domain [Luminiphilus syltensis NOR5-1B]